LPNILLDGKIASLLKAHEQSLRSSVVQAAQSKIPAAGLMSALSYFDGYTSALLPTNLIQAQRDNFGAHTYQRIDREGTFHTEWIGDKT
jgi:6-phosphogluconate dehydrogenase